MPAHVNRSPYLGSHFIRARCSAARETKQTGGLKIHGHHILNKYKSGNFDQTYDCLECKDKGGGKILRFTGYLACLFT